MQLLNQYLLKQNYKVLTQKEIDEFFNVNELQNKLIEQERCKLEKELNKKVYSNDKVDDNVRFYTKKEKKNSWFGIFKQNNKEDEIDCIITSYFDVSVIVKNKLFEYTNSIIPDNVIWEIEKLEKHGCDNNNFRVIWPKYNDKPASDRYIIVYHCNGSIFEVYRNY
jgi:hypothetical protein